MLACGTLPMARPARPFLFGSQHVRGLNRWRGPGFHRAAASRLLAERRTLGLADNSVVDRDAASCQWGMLARAGQQRGRALRAPGLRATRRSPEPPGGPHWLLRGESFGSLGSARLGDLDTSPASALSWATAPNAAPISKPAPGWVGHPPPPWWETGACCLKGAERPRPAGRCPRSTS